MGLKPDVLYGIQTHQLKMTAMDKYTKYISIAVGFSQRHLELTVMDSISNHIHCRWF
jgi:hypothetical protein